MPIPTYTDLPEQISCIDTHYLRPGLAACYLIQAAGEAAIIDTGTAHAVPGIMQLLQHKEIAPAAIKYVIPTHVHLDHAGGAGQLLQQLPEAQLVIHPYGVRHMIDPVKLTAGTTAVYGEKRFKTMFGELQPIAESRVIQAVDGFALYLGSRQLLCLDTPGHARHHICIYDEQSRGFFSGDTFGLSYREFDSRQGPFILPTSTPVQFDPEAWHVTLDRLMSYRPESINLTHFGQIRNPAKLAADLHSAIDDFVSIATQADGPEPTLQIRKGLLKWLLQNLAEHGCPHTSDQVEDLMGMDLDLNAQGLEVWLARKRQK